MAKLQVDYEGLKEMEKSINKQAKTFGDCLDTLDRDFDKLPDVWEGKAAKDYADEYNDCKKTLRDVQELIEELADQLKKASDAYDQMDANLFQKK